MGCSMLGWSTAHGQNLTQLVFGWCVGNRLSAPLRRLGRGKKPTVKKLLDIHMLQEYMLHNVVPGFYTVGLAVHWVA